MFTKYKTRWCFSQIVYKEIKTKLGEDEFVLRIYSIITLYQIFHVDFFVKKKCNTCQYYY
jgi:hypothetical protein